MISLLHQLIRYSELLPETLKINPSFFFFFCVRFVIHPFNFPKHFKQYYGSNIFLFERKDIYVFSTVTGIKLIQHDKKLRGCCPKMQQVL